MDTLGLGMQNLRIAEFFSEHRAPTVDDRDRIADGLNFLRSGLSGVDYADNGATDGLQETSFADARYVSGTLRVLKKVNTFPAVRAYIANLANILDAYLGGKEVSKSEREDLVAFFAAVGEAITTEALHGASVLSDTDSDDPLEAHDALSAVTS
jgi:hypothetical protein